MILMLGMVLLCVATGLLAHHFSGRQQGVVLLAAVIMTALYAVFPYRFM
ncbi:MAG TPA: hypothetical protein VGW38_10610 [Chloroflexota bacterium]|nr:hypothetical protein [Chloroflexota bacterium]